MGEFVEETVFYFLCIMEVELCQGLLMDDFLKDIYT